MTTDIYPGPFNEGDVGFLNYLAALVADVQAIKAMLANVPVIIQYTGSAYPARSTVTTNLTQPVIWVGPDGTKPTPGTQALSGVDYFWGY